MFLISLCRGHAASSGLQLDPACIKPRLCPALQVYNVSCLLGSGRTPRALALTDLVSRIVIQLVLVAIATLGLLLRHAYKNHNKANR